MRNTLIESLLVSFLNIPIQFEIKVMIDTAMKLNKLEEDWRKDIRSKLFLSMFVLSKAHENAVYLTKPNTYTLNLQNLISSECSMVLRELMPYLKLPPDGPSSE